MRPPIIPLIFASVVLALTLPLSAQDPTVFVDPFIGTRDGGNTFPGAVVPWGMVSVSPHNQLTAASGYVPQWMDSILGFGHVHTSGIGCLALGHIVIMPSAGDESINGRYALTGSHGRTASPGYFRVELDKHAITAEATATERVGLHRYRWGRNASTAKILVDVTQGVGESMGGYVRIRADGEIEGWNASGNFCSSPNAFRVYFVARFSRTPARVRLWRDGEHEAGDTTAGTAIGACADFVLDTGQELLVKVGISYTSIENARRNIDAELPGWDFDATHAAARERWRAELSRVDARGGTMDQRRVFYTALYHSLIHPNLLSDANGDYPEYTNHNDWQVHDRAILRDTMPHYTLFSLWDTYHTLHPLLSLVWPDRQRQMMETLIDGWRRTGHLPKWEIAATETWSMIGDPAAIAIADSWERDVPTRSITDALASTLGNAEHVSIENWYRPGIVTLMRYGFIPVDDIITHWTVGPSVSQVLEYAEADAAIARLAALACDDEAYLRAAQRAGFYGNVWDYATGFFRARYADGRWVEQFDSTNWEPPAYCEGSASDYRFYVPQNVPDLIGRSGGGSAFVERLNRFFESEQFEWNEHSFHVPYLYTWVSGEAWRTQREVARRMPAMTASARGIPSNDDAGAISSWYVWSALGLYPSVEGYRLTTPLFDSVTIRPSSGVAPIVILARRSQAGAGYIASAQLNGRALHRPELRHREIAGGATVAFDLHDAPSSWGIPLSAPAVLSFQPGDGEPETRRIEWLPVPGALHYRFQTSNGPTFCTPLHDVTLPAGEEQLVVPVAAADRWWRLGVVDSLGAVAWSRPGSVAATLQSGDEDGSWRRLEIVASGPNERTRREFEVAAGEHADVMVSDALGRQLLHVKLPPARTPSFIDVGRLPAGPLLVAVRNRSGATVWKVLVK